jgi:hypothetical protein
MGRKRTAEEYHRTAAQNRWVPGAHKEEDSREQTKKEPGDRYKQNKQEALNKWVSSDRPPQIGLTHGSRNHFNWSLSFITILILR